MDRFRIERWRREGTRMTIEQSLFEKLVKMVHVKKEPSRFSTSTENQCLNLQRLKTCHYTIRKDTSIAGQPQPMPVLPKPLPQTQ